MATTPVGNHHAKAYTQNDLFSTQDFRRIQRKHPEAVAQAINFNDEKAAFESGKLKALPEDTFIGGTAKKGLKDKAKKAGEAIKEGASKLGKFIGKHKVGAVIVGVVAAAGAAFGIYKGVQAHQNKAQAHQA